MLAAAGWFLFFFWGFLGFFIFGAEQGWFLMGFLGFLVFKIGYVSTVLKTPKTSQNPKNPDPRSIIAWQRKDCYSVNFLLSMWGRGGDGVFSIDKLSTSRQTLALFKSAFLGVNFFQVLQKLNICKLGKKLMPAKSLVATLAVSFRKGCDVNTAGLSRDLNFRAGARFKAVSRFWGFGCRVFLT